MPSPGVAGYIVGAVELAEGEVPEGVGPGSPPPLPHPASRPTSNRPKNVAEAGPRSQPAGSARAGEHGSAGSATDDEFAGMGTIGRLLLTQVDRLKAFRLKVLMQDN